MLAPGDAPGSIAIIPAAPDAALARHRAAAARTGRPLATGERLDLNTATAAELTRLPRVGPALARRLVAHREAQGPFRTLADVDRVSGVGPALLAALAPHVMQGMVPGAGTGSGSTHAPGQGAPAPPGLVDLNRAGEADLLPLPGIGPTKARAIVAYRQARGPFASVEELVRVPGIGPATLTQIRDLVTVGTPRAGN